MIVWGYRKLRFKTSHTSAVSHVTFLSLDLAQHCSRNVASYAKLGVIA